ncbi:MAG: hypothetical protein ACI936_000386 [Paraglaciecola sp.]|jgi:hypothetical protein
MKTVEVATKRSRSKYMDVALFIRIQSPYVIFTTIAVIQVLFSATMGVNT